MITSSVLFSVRDREAAIPLTRNRRNLHRALKLRRAPAPSALQMVSLRMADGLLELRD